MERQREYRRMWGAMLALVIMTVAAMLPGGCTKAVYVPAESAAVRADTDSLARLIRVLVENNSSKMEKETLYVFKNREVTLNEKGDTIKDKADTYVSHDRQLEEENRRLRMENDSLRRVQSRTDSVYIEKPCPEEVVKEVERKRSRWETALLWTGVAAVLAPVALTAFYKKRGCS